VDLKSEGLRRLLVNAAYWCMGMEDKIPPRADVETVGPYEPSYFGFGAFRKGLRPKDYANGMNGPPSLTMMQGVRQRADVGGDLPCVDWDARVW